MNQKERMLNGLPYKAWLDGLEEEREICKQFVYELNVLPPKERGRIPELLKKLLGKTGENVWIEPPFHCDYGWNIEIGENFYSNHNLVILDPAKVTFGDNVLIGPNCGFYTAGHPLNIEERNKGLEYAKPIAVGNNVWFGGNVAVMPGVTIGDNCTIAAGSIVTKDIPDNSLAAGVPCKVIRKIQ